MTGPQVLTDIHLFLANGDYKLYKAIDKNSGTEHMLCFPKLHTEVVVGITVTEISLPHLKSSVTLIILKPQLILLSGGHWCLGFGAL